MKKVILDENLPVSLRHHLTDFDVVTVQYQGWAGIQNGDLIALVDGLFDFLLTADQNLRYQQNLEIAGSRSLSCPSSGGSSSRSGWNGSNPPSSRHSREIMSKFHPTIDHP
ncbi:MAG: hypothetical protein ACO3JG_14855 [Luteolibacter sp.]